MHSQSQLARYTLSYLFNKTAKNRARIAQRSCQRAISLHDGFQVMGKGKAIKCIHCDNPATYHLTQIVENKIHKIDLCEECANSQGLTDPDSLDLDALIKQVDTHEEAETLLEDETSTEACSLSGATFEDFKKTGRLGSAACYTLFEDRLMPILKTMHRGDRHVGKTPRSNTESSGSGVESLQRELQRAISQERYEEAARLRDAISAEDSKGEEA